MNFLKKTKRVSAKFIPLLLTVTMIVGLVTPLSANAWQAAPETSQFSDVRPDDWFHDYVSWAYVNDITTGIRGTTEFRPGDNVTRAQFATFIHRVEGEPPTSPIPFGDRSSIPGWAEDAVGWAANVGITTGFLQDNTFRPNNNITREQIATMLYRHAQHAGLDLTAPDNAAWRVFPDRERVSNWALTEMRWAVHHKIITGLNGNLSPQSNATRAQTVTMLNRYVVNLGVPAPGGSILPEPEGDVSISDIEKALATNEPIPLKPGGTEIGAAALIAARDIGGDLQFILPNGIHISIPTETIESPSLIDLFVEVDLEEDPEPIPAHLAGMDIIVPQNALIISPNHKGAFGFVMHIHIPKETADSLPEELEKVLASNGEVPLRHVSSFGLVTESGRLEKRPSGLVAVINHSSQYVSSEETPASDVQLEAMRIAELMVQRNTRWEGSYVSPNWVYHYLTNQRGFAQTDARFAAINVAGVDWDSHAARFARQVMTCCCRNRWPMTRDDLINNLIWSDFTQESTNHALASRGMATVDWNARAAAEVARIKADYEQWGWQPEGDWLRESVINQISWGRYTQSQVNHALAANGFAEITDWNSQAVNRMRDLYQWQGRSREGILHQMMQEGFTNAQINYAAYEVLYDVDWNAQAVRNVRNNIEWNSWGSRQQIIDNLKWEGFTESQITHATAFLDSRNVDWYAQAVNTIRNEIENEWFIEHGTTSYRRMIDNLRSWGFTPSQVNHAIAFLDSQDVDWNNQAVNAAQNVMNWSSTQDNGISYNGLVRQLSDDWMSFTLPQATHGANSVGAPTAAIWNAQAVTAASRITSCCCFTTNANENTDRNRMLIERLISSGFTQAQTNHVLTVRDGFTPVENWQFLANQRAVEIQGWGSPREDIIRQLISSGFTQPQTDLALNSIGLSQVPNWQIFANEIAQGFIDDVNGRGFTSRSLIWELIWFGFTREQADNAVSSLIGADWYAEAAKRVKSSSLWGWATSRQGLIDSMVNGDGFTQAQAEQAVSGVSEKLWYDNAILRAAQLNRELLREGKEPSTGLIISIMTDEEGFTLSQAEAAIENASRARYIEAERDALNTLNSTWSQGISREGLIRDLQSEWRGFTQSQAVAAVEAIEAAGDVDWNEQAVKRFEAYVSWGNVGTRDWFIETLTSEWELFTEAQAIQAVPPADDLIWERLAVIVVENRLNLDFEWNQGISRSALIRDLQDMGYSPTTVPAEADPIWVDQAKRSAQWRLDLENEWSQGISRSALIRDLQEQSGFTESQAIAAAPAETDPSWNAHAVRRFQTMVVSWGSTGSRQGFIDQLTNEWNGFTPAQAEHAVPATSDPIWDSMATLEAQRRLDLENEWSQGVSRAALIRELQESGFTPAQALAAVPAEADPIWNAQIIRRAENILLHNPSFFEDATGFIRQLIMDFDFTQEQTNHALTVIPGFTPIADWQSLANQRAAEMQGSSWELDSIIHNLRSSGFTQPQTDAALISIGLGAVDWQAYANRKAQELIASNQGCGPRSLARDLIWQGATHEQADIAVNNLSGVDWYAQAVMRAESFISWGWERSRQQFISQLTGGDGFTQAQADHAVNVVLG